MSETERELVNELLETILAKDPSLLDITATIESTLESISAVTRQSELRTKLEGILQLQIRIAGVADTALRASFNGLIAARNDKKIAYLTDSLSLHRFAEENDGFKKQLDEYFQKTSANNLATSTMVWSALTADDEEKARQMQIILQTASFAEESPFAFIGEKLREPENQAPLLPLLAKLKSDDPNSQVFLTTFGNTQADVYANFSAIIDEYNKDKSNLAVKTAITKAIAKIIAIEKELKTDFATALANAIKENDSIVRLNRITASTDTLQGNGFFDEASYTNRSITNKEALVCGVNGSGTNEVKYSFKWTDGSTNTIFDWTLPSTSKTNTSKIFIFL